VKAAITVLFEHSSPTQLPVKHDIGACNITVVTEYLIKTAGENTYIVYSYLILRGLSQKFESNFYKIKTDRNSVFKLKNAQINTSTLDAEFQSFCVMALQKKF
jgi:hypothetical protein